MPNQELRDRLRESYDRQSLQRDAHRIAPWKVEERSGFLSLLKKERKNTLLEIGSGTGRDSRFFQDGGLTVTCIDLSPENIKLCHQKGLTALVMDVGELQFPADSFDAVYALNSLLHLPHVELPVVLRRINAVLKPHGLFYLGVYGGYDHEGVWERDSYTPQRFFAFYSDERVQQIAAEVFDILAFMRIMLDENDPIHFQALTLRKRDLVR